MLYQFLQRARGHHLSTLRPSSRAKIDDVIRLADGVFIVFHHHNAIALVLQTVQRAQQPRIVTGVQADGGLVQDITHATQVRAQLRGQA
jgi:hypothetical protein